VKKSKSQSCGGKSQNPSRGLCKSQNPSRGVVKGETLAMGCEKVKIPIPGWKSQNPNRRMRKSQNPKKQIGTSFYLLSRVSQDTRVHYKPTKGHL
jgi:23S rRNA-/tRNA-specific pseudouridylate synthase